MTLYSDGEIKVWTSQFGQPPPTPPPAEVEDDRTIRTTKSKAPTEGGDTDDATRTRRRLSHVTANMSKRRNSDTTQLTNFTNPDMKSNKQTSSSKHLSVKSVLDALHDESSEGSLSEAPSEEQLLLHPPLTTHPTDTTNTPSTDEVHTPQDKGAHSHRSTNKQALLHRFRIHTKAITGIILHKLPHCVISSSLDGFIKILDLEEFTVIGSYDLGHRISDLQYIIYDSRPCCLLGLDYRFIRVWAMIVLAEKVLSYDEDVMRFSSCVALHSTHMADEPLGASAAVNTALKIPTSTDQASSSRSDCTSDSSSRNSSSSSSDSDANSDASSPAAIDATVSVPDPDILLAVVERGQAYVVETSHELCIYNSACKPITYIEQTQVLEGVISCQISLAHQTLFVLFKSGLIRVYSLVSSPATVLSSVLLGDVLHSPSQGSSAKHLHPTTSIRYTAMTLIDVTPVYDSSVVHIASKDAVHSHAHVHGSHDSKEVLVIGSQGGYLHFFKTSSGGHGAPTHQSSFSVIQNSTYISSSSSPTLSASSHYISSIHYQPSINATANNTITNISTSTVQSSSSSSGSLFILLSPTQSSTDNISIIQIWTMPEINRASVIEIISITSMSCYRVAPLSNVIACGSRDGSIYLYSYDSHLKLTSTYNQSNNSAYSSGESNSSGGERDGGRECIGYSELISDNIQSHDDEVIDIAFSSYYQLYTSCSRDMTVKIWSFRKELICNLTFESISMSVSFYGTGRNTVGSGTTTGGDGSSSGDGISGSGGSGGGTSSNSNSGLDILITQSSHVSVVASSVWNKGDKTFPMQTILTVDNNTSVSAESQGVVVERDTEYNMVASHVAASPPTSAVGSYRSPRTRNAILKQPHPATTTVPTSKVNEFRLPSLPDSVPGPDPSIPIVSTATTTAIIDPPSSTSEALVAGVGVPVDGLGVVRTGPTIKETLSTAIHKPWEKRQRMFKIRSADINDADYKASWSLYIQQKNKYTKNIQTVPVTVLK